MTVNETAVATEERVDAETAHAWTSLLERLSRQSVTPGKHFDAYADVAWDDPDYRIDPADPRWELALDEPLAATSWYRAQPAEVRARIGLHMVVTKMKIGLQFESILKRGLLEFAATLPNRSPEFRYAYHEVIEEAQHSLMFQEFVNRSGIDVKGMPWRIELGARRVVHLGRRFPALFFMFVLGGEDPIDYVQREALRSDNEVHPLLERIMRIHVTEEARHLSFARHYLKNNVPKLARLRRFALAMEAPLILGTMSQLMLRPSSDIVRTYSIPRSVVKEAYSKNPAHEAGVRASLRKVRTLAQDLGLITPLSKPIWKAFGIWEELPA
ncbi:MAG TPA: diiron oxygenase [Acidimicrobiales bacterium]|nr:diiron oxygenase [Acidimicrobiales bacterium]